MAIQKLKKWNEVRKIAYRISGDLVKKYNLHDFFDDFFNTSFVIFDRCLKKYDGRKKAKFSTYFYKWVKFELEKIAIRECQERKKHSIQEIEERGDGGVEARMPGFLTIKKDFFLNSLNPFERKIFTLKAEKLTLCQISEKLDLSIEETKKIWENIKVKIGKYFGKEIKTRKKYEREYQKKWRSKNPDYHKEWQNRNKEHYKKLLKKWRERNPLYFKNYVERNYEKIKEYKRKYMREFRKKKNAKVCR